MESISTADAVVFGSPTYMGCVSAQFKAFADATGELWSKGKWVDKVAAGFTIGSNLSGDQLSVIQYISTFANQHGMLWSGLDIRSSEALNRLGAQSGLIAHSSDGTVHETDRKTAHYLGARVARIIQSLVFKRQVEDDSWSFWDKPSQVVLYRFRQLIRKVMFRILQIINTGLGKETLQYWNIVSCINRSVKGTL